MSARPKKTMESISYSVLPIDGDVDALVRVHAPEADGLAYRRLMAEEGPRRLTTAEVAVVRRVLIRRGSCDRPTTAAEAATWRRAYEEVLGRPAPRRRVTVWCTGGAA